MQHICYEHPAARKGGGGHAKLCAHCLQNKTSERPIDPPGCIHPCMWACGCTTTCAPTCALPVLLKGAAAAVDHWQGSFGASVSSLNFARGFDL
eukprot:358778-Pelagomonas_calceolata.AAC.3